MPDLLVDFVDKPWLKLIEIDLAMITLKGIGLRYFHDHLHYYTQLISIQQTQLLSQL